MAAALANCEAIAQASGPTARRLTSLVNLSKAADSLALVLGLELAEARFCREV
jgi:hypothetical protein